MHGSLGCVATPGILELQSFVITERYRPGLVLCSAGGSGMIFSARLWSGYTTPGLSATRKRGLLVPSWPLLWFDCFPLCSICSTCTHSATNVGSIANL